MGTNRDRVDLTGSALSEEDLLIENAYRKITTPSGALFWAPNNTTDVRELLLKSISEDDCSTYAGFIESLFRNDSRCFARCSMSLVGTDLQLNLVMVSRKDGATYEVDFLITPYQVKILTEAAA